MSALAVFNFETNDVRVVTGVDGNPLFVAKDVAVALGYQNTNEAVNTHCDDGVAKLYPIQDSMNRTQKVRVIDESDVYSLIFGSKLESSKRFKKWVTSEVLPTIRKTGRYNVEAANDSTLRIEESLRAVEFVAQSLRLPDSGKLGMFQQVFKLKAPELLPALPGYAVDTPSGVMTGSSEPTKALQVLLKEHGADLTPYRANKLLEEIGYLEKLTRPSKSKGTKEFWSVTEKGLEFPFKSDRNKPSLRFGQ